MPDANFTLTLDLPNDNIVITDTTDDAGFTANLAFMEGFIVSIVAPDGSTVYANPASSGTPDIADMTTSRASATAIAIPKTSGGVFQQGDYVVTYQAVNSDNQDEYDKVKTIDFSGYTKPTGSITHTVKLGSDTEDPSFKSVDVSNYSISDWGLAVTYAHELAYPQDIITATTNTAQTITVTEFYTGVQTTTMVASLTYTVGTDLIILEEVTTIESTTVVAASDLCQLNTFLNAINAKYLAVKGSNSTSEGRYFKLWQRAVGLAASIREAAHCGDTGTINTDFAEIQEIYSSLICAADSVVTPTLVTTPFSVDKNTVTVAYASNTSGSNFSFTPLESSLFYGLFSHNKIYTPIASDYDGLWVSINPDGLELGETDSTAYRGDRGKLAYDHSQITDGNPHGVRSEDIVSTLVESDTISNGYTFDLSVGDKFTFTLGEAVTLVPPTIENGTSVKFSANVTGNFALILSAFIEIGDAYVGTILNRLEFECTRTAGGTQTDIVKVENLV